MADGMFNIGRGRAGYYFDDALGLSGANSRLVIVVLEAVEADDTLNNHTVLGGGSGLLDAAGNTEATSTGYSRKQLAAADVSITINNSTNQMQVEVDADQTWTSVSQAGSESWVKLLICYDADNTGGGDASIIPVTYHDFSVTPNGSDINADFAPQFYVSS